SSRRYPIYRCTIENEVTYCVPIIGRGLWSKLYGYLSLESDLNTVKGITFYKHGETPGLGAEIEKSWFQDNFLGKKINDQTGTFISIEVVKGKATDAYAGNEEKLSHAVDGISGATITSRGVTKMLHEDLTKYVPYFKQLEAN
ncbi:MAG: NADH:ubiquinone reductase (Na(+)-transporting) subunit C, partial [Pirellulaceae bacterium]|nr:NADH:ubiquinone reductase (Na(+)-transporting) subunit C [Pirellulaceae bacterium]